MEAVHAVLMIADAAGSGFATAVRETLATGTGREIDRSDGFLLRFGSVDEATGFATALHDRLAESGSPAARIAIHVGPLLQRQNDPADVAAGAKPVELEGLAKPVTARIHALAGPGRTLLSEDALDALTTDGLGRAAHGYWLLKGVADPVGIWEVGALDAAFLPPEDGPKAWRVVFADGAWRRPRDLPHRLPAERDRFVGRDEVLRSLQTRIETGARLVTVLGIGGVGKTRFVLRYAWLWLGEWPGGAWFCDASEAREGADLIAALARALDVPLSGAASADQLGHALASRGRCLVVLDNLEQIVRDVPALLERWLDLAPAAVFVATSREVLAVPGEQVLTLAPLSAEASCALYAARAAAVARAGPNPPKEHDAVLKLMALLDGLPLAIELAAARRSTLSASQMVDRIGERFRLLAGPAGRRDRQSTLRATLDWSWDLLRPWEKAALSALSVFEGGFDVAAAEAVLDLGAWPDALTALDSVASLVGKSLVTSRGEGRFDLLVTVQEYAAGRLDAAGPGARAAAQARHAAHFAARSTAPRSALSRDFDNHVAACRRSVLAAEARPALANLEALWRVVRRRGPYLLAAGLAELVAGTPGAPDAVVARAYTIAGNAFRQAGRSVEAIARLESALAISRRCGDRVGESGQLRAIGQALHACGRTDEGARYAELSRLEAVASGDALALAEADAELGVLKIHAGEPAEARRFLSAANEAARVAGARELFARSHQNLALVAFMERDYATAERLMLALLADLDAPNDPRGEAHVLGYLAAVYEATGRRPEAIAANRRALALARRVGDRRYEGGMLANLGSVLHNSGAFDEAAQCLRGAIAIAVEMSDRWYEGNRRMNLGNTYRCLGREADALAEYQAAAALPPGASAAQIQLRLSERLFDLGRRAEAQAHLDSAVARADAKNRPDHASEISSQLAVVHADAGRWEDAARCLADAAGLAGQESAPLVQMYLARSRVARFAGDSAAARAALAEAARHAPAAGVSYEREVAELNRVIDSEVTWRAD